MPTGPPPLLLLPSLWPPAASRGAGPDQVAHAPDGRQLDRRDIMREMADFGKPPKETTRPDRRVASLYVGLHTVPAPVLRKNPLR